MMKSSLVLLAMLWVTVAISAESTRRILSCKAFPPELSEEQLKKTFGAKNVATDQISIGEGETVEGTVLFPEDSKNRLEIIWKDKAAKKSPERVQAGGAKTRWRTPEGITIGSTLKWIEKLNRRPFRLLGFGWDYAGTVISWSKGRLEDVDGDRCKALVRLTPATGYREDPVLARARGQVSGDREFSSGHPAMQTLNPTVYEIALQYPGR